MFQNQAPNGLEAILTSIAFFLAKPFDIHTHDGRTTARLRDGARVNLLQEKSSEGFPIAVFKVEYCGYNAYGEFGESLGHTVSGRQGAIVHGFLKRLVIA